jgi:ArsR family transcriptional regulator, arsenate/arsenite/antimonite-responsive transcriptional repressor
VLSGRSDFVELKITLRAMSTNTSLSILHALALQGELTVTDLVSTLGFSQPLISWHLRNLRRVGLVCTRRQGRIVYCSLDRTRFAACQQMLSDLIAPPSQPHAAGSVAGQAPASTGGTPDCARPESMAGSPRSRAGPDVGP